MFVVALFGMLAAISLPQIAVGLDRIRAVGAARYLAHQCGMARLHAVARGRYVALQFEPMAGEYAIRYVVDGNRDGVRAADISAGIDAPLTPAERLSANFPGVRIGLDPSLGLGTDPLRLSGSSLLSFSPEGTATAGTVYVLGRDGTQLAVRILGTTGRTRVQRYERTTATWVQP